MRLKSLKLAGFKSFANPTTFRFNQNITAIVGPNGCGKSNVIDAIRWVLGESSAKQLRGGAMSDVIFAGTQNTSAKSLASVELTFEHTQDEHTGIRHELNLYHELSVRRQVNKEGKSSYFINGTRCRRRDVVDVFLGTGLGSRSYAVIEQGMIGRIVDSSPMQLREFIEEGAGVSRYQVRRLETQKKLTQTQENLSRLYDLRSELEKQQKTLSQQANTAKQYKELVAQQQRLEQDIAIHQLYSAKYTEQQQQKQHTQLKQWVDGVQAELNVHVNNLDKIANRIAEQQWLKDDARDKLHDEQLKQQQAEHALTQHQTSIQQLIDKQSSYRQQKQQQQSQVTELINKHQREVAQLNDINPQLTELQARQLDIQAKLEPLNEQWQSIYAKRDGLQNEQRTLEKQHALAEQANHRVHQELDKWQQRQQRWKQAVEAQTYDEEDNLSLPQLESMLDNQQNQLASILRQTEDVLTRTEDEEQRLDTLKEQVKTAQQSLQTLEKQQATLTSEYNTLHALVHPKKNRQHPLDTESSDSSLTATQLSQTTQLNQSIELTSQGQAQADTLDMWLGMWLDALVNNIDNIDNDCLSLLMQTTPSSQNNVILTKSDAIKHPIKEAALSEQPELEKLFQQCIPLNSLIKSPQLTLWQGAYLINLPVDNASDVLDNLQALLTVLPEHAWILTSTGWVIGHFGFMHLTKLSTADSHFLQQRTTQRKRLAELEEQLNSIDDNVEDKQAELNKQQASQDELQIIVQELTAQANHLQQQTHSHRQTITQLTAKIEQKQSDNKRHQREEQQLNQDKIALDAEQLEITKQLTILNKSLPSINEELKQIEAERMQIRQQRIDADTQKNQVNDKLQALMLQQQKWQMSIQNIIEQQSQLEQQLQGYDTEQQKISSDIEQKEKQLPELEKQVKLQQETCHEWHIKLEEYQEQLAQQQLEYTTQRGAHAKEQEKMASKQQQLTELTTHLAIAKERLAEACQRVDSLANEQRKINSARLLSECIVRGSFEPNKEDSKQQKRQQEYQALQLKVGRIGAVNLVAVEELEEVNQRLESLTSQIEDIVASIQKLSDGIKTIDEKTKKLFMQTLESVNKDLVHLFSKVFGGGHASLTLIEDDSLSKADKWRAGLALMAQPKGKKNNRLAVLSGGEKTLTALSMIFAIFKQHPAPFCVLDEVDAPLDDANVGRFTGLINELAKDLQFIFISHNKLAMQIADELKGITMPTAGISSLVSVSLDEAERYIVEEA